jgi:hypothetical protein
MKNKNLEYKIINVEENKKSKRKKVDVSRYEEKKYNYKNVIMER